MNTTGVRPVALHVSICSAVIGDVVICIPSFAEAPRGSGEGDTEPARRRSARCVLAERHCWRSRKVSVRRERVVPLLGLADQVVPRTPPSRQAHVVAPAFAGGHEHVTMRQLAETLAGPDDHGVVAVEEAEGAAARLVASGSHWSSPPQVKALHFPVLELRSGWRRNSAR